MSKTARRVANKVDSHQTLRSVGLIWVYTVCTGLSGRKHGINTKKAVFFEVYCTYATFLFLVVSDVETEYYSKDVNYYQEQ